MQRAQPDAVDLRPWSETDLPLEDRLMGDPAMTTYLGGPEPAHQSRKRHEHFLRMNDSGTGRMFVIVMGPQRIAAGSVGYWETEWQEHRIWEAGWSVLPAFQGQGIATRATAAMIEYARAAGTYQFLHAFPAVANGPSNAVCRKVGFTLLGEVDFEYPPGTVRRCHNWRVDLVAGRAVARPS